MSIPSAPSNVLGGVVMSGDLPLTYNGAFTPILDTIGYYSGGSPVGSYLPPNLPIYNVQPPADPAHPIPAGTSIVPWIQLF